MDALEDITVLELAFYYPGPLCGLLLSEMGARVIKIESRDGDPLRPLGATGEDSMGPSFKSLNRGKKSVVMDLKTDQGMDGLVALLEQADVLLQVFRPSVMERLGLGVERVRRINPRLVHCVMTGYGMNGPHAQRAGHDLNYQSLAGIVSMTGLADGSLALPGVPLGDLSGALMATLAIVAAIRQRDRTGQGKLLDISLTEGAAFANALNVVGRGFDSEELRAGQTMLTGRIPCYNLYRSRDGSWFSLAALEPKFWVHFCTAAGREDLMALQFDPSGVESIRNLFASEDASHWRRIADGTESCLEPVLAPDELAEHPLHRARRTVFRGPDGQDHVKIPGMDEPDRSRLSAPELGEHTDEILD